MRLIAFTTFVTLVVVMLMVPISGEVAEQQQQQQQQRRRPLFRRAKPTTSTSEPATGSDDSEGSESKGHQRSDPFSVITTSSNQSPGQPPSGASFKADQGDKLTSFSEYSFGNHAKLLPSGEEASPDDEPNGYAGFKNHKSVATASLLPQTNANKAKPFDFLARDYAKAKGSFGAGAGIQQDTATTGGLLGSKSTKTSSSSSSSVSSKFSISHPSPIGSPSKATGKLAHLDDSTEYDVYAGLGQSSATGKTKLGATSKYRPSGGSTFGSAASAFDGKVKKVPFKYEDGAFGAGATKAGTKTKSKLTLDDDNPLAGYDGAYGGKQQHQQQQQSLLQASKSKFNFAEPPALVKSTLSTLKHFGDGLLGNGAYNPYDQDSDEGGAAANLPAFHGGVTGAAGGKFGAGNHHHNGYPGAGQPAGAEESYEVVASGELGAKLKPYHQQLPGKLPPSSSLSGAGGGKFATDFDVKNIKLTGDGVGGAVFGGPKYHHQQSQHHHHHQQGGNTPLHHTTTKQQQHLGHPGQHQHQLQLHQQQLQHAHNTLHAPTHATGSIDNPNPLDFRPNFQLQDVPNLYPRPGALGAGIAAKGQIESFLNAEQYGLKDESLVAQLLGQQSEQHPGSAGGRPSQHYHTTTTLQKSKEEEQLEKEALRQQIEYLKAQAAKRPVDLSASNPARPAIVSNAQKFRPVRRIPQHVRLGVKSPYPLPRIPHYNDRPYSISFKI